MDNVVTAVFRSEKEAQLALEDLRENPMTGTYAVSQASLVKKVNGNIVTNGTFDSGVKTKNDTVLGTVVGGIAGLAAGPVGALVVGGLGALGGTIKDEDDELRSTQIINYAASRLINGEAAIIALAREDEPNSLDAVFQKYIVRTSREEISNVKKELRKEERAAIKKDLTS